MEIISRLKNLSSRKLAWITLLVAILTLAISLLYGTLSILYVRNSDAQLLLIRHTELLRLINKLEVQNVLYICKDELPTSEPNLSTSVIYGKSSAIMIRNMDYLKRYYTPHSSTLLYKYFRYGSFYTSSFRSKPIFEPRFIRYIRRTEYSSELTFPVEDNTGDECETEFRVLSEPCRIEAPNYQLEQ